MEIKESIKKSLALLKKRNAPVIKQGRQTNDAIVSAVIN
jgi:hypothetical protein